MKIQIPLLTVSILLLSIFNPSNAKQELFCSDQLVAHPIKNGYTWTIASRLGELLGLAETEYGERDKNWTILGVEFNKEDGPQNWHPFSSKKKRYIIIQLGKGTANNEKKMLFQLAHEIFHTLSPIQSKESTYFEEGLATYFSIKATQLIGVNITPDYISSARYRKAYRLVSEVYKAHPDTGKRIALFRKSGAKISSLDEDNIRIIFPKIKKTLAISLAKKFSRSTVNE